MTSKTSPAIEEIRGRIELLTKQSAEARHQARWHTTQAATLTSDARDMDLLIAEYRDISTAAGRIGAAK